MSGTNPFEEELRASTSSNPFEQNPNPFDDEIAAVDAPHAAITLAANPFDEDDQQSLANRQSPETPTWLHEAAAAVQPSATPPVEPPRPPNPIGSEATGNPVQAADVSSAIATAPTQPPAMAEPSPSPAPIEVEPPSFTTDMAHGCESLLASGRHADLQFQLPARTIRAHRCLLEVRCGAMLVQALVSGALGEAKEEEGMLSISLPTAVVGDASGASLAALLAYVYTECFDTEPLAGRGGAIALLRLTMRLEALGSSPALERLRQLCERELAAAVVPETVVASAHEAFQLGAAQLLRYCLQVMNLGFAQLSSSGRLATLQMELCASLFAMRSEAPLQEALAHGRADVVEWMLARDEGGAATLVSVADSRGRTALEVALSCDDLPSATLLLSKRATADAMAGGGDEPLLHTVCHSYDEAPDARREELSVRKLTLLLEHGAAVGAMNGRGESALDVAFFHGGPSIVSLLLRHSTPSTMITEAGGCVLHAAALSRRADVLEAALGCLGAIGVDLNQQDSAGCTPLHVAVSSTLLALVKPLLRMKASTEVQADDGSTPLRLAVADGNLELTKALLDVGADCNALGGDGSPLIVVAAETSVQVATALVQAGADLNQMDGTGRTALEMAVTRGEFELCELLLSRGARTTNRKDAHGNTALHTAVANQAEGIVRLLVMHKAELHEQNRKGQTPLIIGAETGQENVVELLLHSGAPLHLCDVSNRSALEIALESGHLGVLKILLQQSIVDVNGITKRGSSLLHLAAEIGDEERVTFLLSMQAQVDVLNPNGETPLHWACSLGHLGVVRALVQYGASTMLHERVQGLTPLHAACGSRGQPAVLALLIQRCEIMGWNNQPQKCNLLDANRNTPLHTCTKLAPQAAKYLPILLEHGANPNLPNGQGQTVLHLLAERAVREQQERLAVTARENHDGTASTTELAPGELPVTRLVEMLSEHNLHLDAQEHESGNTALHHAAFGGCIELAVQLVSLGASVGLPNKDGFTPLDSSFRSAADPTRSLQSLLLGKITKPSSWTPDRMVTACQNCKLPFNKADPNRARKHHCRHCGRCICSPCSPTRMNISKFASSQDERVCLLCERVLTAEAS